METLEDVWILYLIAVPETLKNEKDDRDVRRDRVSMSTRYKTLLIKE